MSYILVFIPVWMSMALALRDQYDRKNTISTVILCVTSVLLTLRFTILAHFFDGGERTLTLTILEELASLYIPPFTYMFLCDQCGTFWNNRQAKWLLVLPFAMLLSFVQGCDHRVLRCWIVVVQCLVICLCMVRLWLRIRDYGLKFTGAFKMYYSWMAALLTFTILSFVCYMDASDSPVVQWLFFLVYAVIISAGFLIIPYSFQITRSTKPEQSATQMTTTPAVEQAVSQTQEVQPVEESEEFGIKLSEHLVEGLHKIMEEEEYYLDVNINIDDLAHKLGTNRTYVTRLMRQEYGLTFIEYVNVARIQHSQKLLYTNPDITLDEVAFKSGFQSTSNYCRAFKRYTGTTPKGWLQDAMH